MLAGVDVQRLRGTPLYQALPLVQSETLKDVSEMLVASDSKELLIALKGSFATTPVGSTLVEKGVAVMGAPSIVQSALAQHRTGNPGSPGMEQRGEVIAPRHPIWMVARGGIALPLTGNLANLNRLFRQTEYVTLSAAMDGAIDLELAGHCRTSDDARHFEDTLRAVVSLATMANSRNTALAAGLQSIQMHTEILVVKATLSTSYDTAAKLLNGLIR